MQEKVSIKTSSLPMLHYALGMDFPIHTRNTRKILINYTLIAINFNATNETHIKIKINVCPFITQ